MMTRDVIFRFVALGVLWLFLVGYILTHAEINFFTLFAIFASAVIVFVPVYKKYVKKK